MYFVQVGTTGTLLYDRKIELYSILIKTIYFIIKTLYTTQKQHTGFCRTLYYKKVKIYHIIKKYFDTKKD